MVTGDEPLPSVEVRNFLISSGTVSSVFLTVTVMMKCVCVCVCVYVGWCVCDVCVCVCVGRVVCVCVCVTDCGGRVSCQSSWCDLTGVCIPSLRPAIMAHDLHLDPSD